MTFAELHDDSRGRAVEIGFNVLDTQGGEYDFDVGVQEVAATLQGRVVSAETTDVDGYAAVDVEMAYGRGNVVMFQLVDADEHVLQPLVVGPAEHRDVVQRTFEQLTGSLDVGSP